MNYASVVWVFFAVISVVWYFVHGRKFFTGPPVASDANPIVEGKGTLTDDDGELAVDPETKQPMKVQ